MSQSIRIVMLCFRKSFGIRWEIGFLMKKFRRNVTLCGQDFTVGLHFADLAAISIANRPNIWQSR
jgi:hypothetical protein